MAIKRIGILTGGGDVPGLNAVIKSATYRSSESDIDNAFTALAQRGGTLS